MKKLFYFTLSIVLLSACNSTHLSHNHYDLRLIKREVQEELTTHKSHYSSSKQSTLSKPELNNKNPLDTSPQTDSINIDTIEIKSLLIENISNGKEVRLKKESKTTILKTEDKKIDNEKLSSALLLSGSVLLTIGILLIQTLPIVALLMVLAALICAVLVPTLTMKKAKKNLSSLLKILCSIALIIIVFWIIISFLSAITSGVDLGIGGRWNII
jgi:hypothetical protein